MSKKTFRIAAECAQDVETRVCKRRRSCNELVLNNFSPGEYINDHYICGSVVVEALGYKAGSCGFESR
jgi:hypothetical protein